MLTMHRLPRSRMPWLRVSARFSTAYPPSVSAQRLGIVVIYETLAVLEGRAITSRDDKAIWTDALTWNDPLALAALDRLCLALGAVAVDLALTHKANGVVLAHRLIGSGFGKRFVAKGRFRSRMMGLPIKGLVHPQRGLFGEAAAFARHHG